MREAFCLHQGAVFRARTVGEEKGGSRCAGSAPPRPRCASPAAVEETGDWHAGNASLGGPGDSQAATGAPALQSAIITSRLKNKSFVVF